MARARRRQEAGDGGRGPCLGPPVRPQASPGRRPNPVLRRDPAEAYVAQSAALAIWIVSACAETVLIASASGIKNDAVLFMLVLISGLLLWLHYAAEEDYQAGAGFSNEEDERGRGLALPDCLRRSGGLAEGKRHACCDRRLDSPVAYGEGN